MLKANFVKHQYCCKVLKLKMKHSKSKMNPEDSDEFHQDKGLDDGISDEQFSSI